MGKKLTKEDVQLRLNQYFEQDVILVSDYINNKTSITLHCNECGYEWQVKPTAVLYDDYKHYCPNCKAQNTGKIVTCAYCGKRIRRVNSDIKKNQSGYFYCSKSCGNAHKNIIRAKNGEWDDSNNYRLKAFNSFEHRCMICGWDEDERILEVHHLDSNRENNDISNLSILCPTCHRKITLGYYKIDNNFKMIRIK